MVKVWISKMIFKDGSIVNLDQNDIVVLVGPNNAGKSVTLREASTLLANKNNNKTKVLRDVEISQNGSEDELISYLDTFATKKNIGEPLPQFIGYQFELRESHGRARWKSIQKGLLELNPIFSQTLNTEGRLGAANPPKNIKLTTDPPRHPIHFLQKDDAIEYRFSDYFKQAFGLDLIVHRNAGDLVPLYIGDRPIPNAGEDRISAGYLSELEKLDLLHEQGDGMRSFVGVLLNAFISHHSVLFLDEPEAFLHPPQARLLGKMLAKDLPSERQLFLATHSEDFLKGLLDASISNLKIIRIQRDGSANKISILESSDINTIWNDSLLRHSNVLSGLFHSRVIICESDSDCRFFSAILATQFEGTTTIAPDVLFIHCGGKHRIPTAVKALKKLNVGIKVVSDFDILNDTNPLKETFEDLGGTWNDIEADWKLVKTEIEQKRPEFLTADLKTELENILDTSERIFPTNKIKEIQRALKKASAWTEAKEIGKSYIPSGNATLAFDRIQVKLLSVGLHVLEIGELESFCKSVGNHGPKWVTEVLTKDLKNDPELEVARQFIQRLLS